MPTFVTTHLAPGLSAEEIAGNAPTVAESVHAQFRHLYVNMFTGQIFTVYEADNAEDVAREFERVGFPYDDVTEVQFSLDAAALQNMVSGQSA